MTSLLVLIPVALILGALGLAAFLWAMKSGQFDDLDGAAARILNDDEIGDDEMGNEERGDDEAGDDRLRDDDPVDRHETQIADRQDRHL